MTLNRSSFRQVAPWKDAALQTTLFEPFEILRHSNQESRRKENENAGSGRDSGIWGSSSLTRNYDLWVNSRWFTYPARHLVADLYFSSSVTQLRTRESDLGRGGETHP
jgi:hypothetical protein